MLIELAKAITFAIVLGMLLLINSSKSAWSPRSTKMTRVGHHQHLVRSTQLPCNVLERAPAFDWALPSWKSGERRDPSFHCWLSSADGRHGKPRKNSQEDRQFAPWFKSRYLRCAFANTSACQNDTQNTALACPELSWYLRAGLGNRFFFVAATVILAAEKQTAAYLPTPLGPFGPLAAGAAADAPEIVGVGCSSVQRTQCVRPVSKDYGGNYGQGRKTTSGLAQLRPTVCDAVAAPLLLPKAHTPLLGDIVVHVRAEGPRALGLLPEVTLKAAVADARTRLGGKRIVLVTHSSTPPLILDAIRDAVGPYVRPQLPRMELANDGRNLSSALRDMQFISMARIIILGFSTFSFWAAYLSESADAIYFPLVGLADRHTAFNPWCHGIEAFRGRKGMYYVTATGSIITDPVEAKAKCHR